MRPFKLMHAVTGNNLYTNDDLIEIWASTVFVIISYCIYVYILHIIHVQQYYYICSIAINVTFNNPSYTVEEWEGSVQLTLLLDKPSPCCIHMLVKFTDRTALGELCVVCICVLITVPVLIHKKYHIFSCCIYILA